MFAMWDAYKMPMAKRKKYSIFTICNVRLYGDGRFNVFPKSISIREIHRAGFSPHVICDSWCIIGLLIQPS